MDQGMLSELQDTLTKVSIEERFSRNGLWALTTCPKILFSKAIDFTEVYHLNDFFKLEAGRRLFTQRLKQTMKSVRIKTFAVLSSCVKINHHIRFHRSRYQKTTSRYCFI